MDIITSFMTGTIGLIVLIVVHLVIGSFTGWLAGNKGYESTITWFFAGFFFGIFGLLTIGLASNLKYEKQLINLSEKLEKLNINDSPSETRKSKDTKNDITRCVKCRKIIPPDSLSCTYCGAPVVA